MENNISDKIQKLKSTINNYKKENNEMKKVIVS